MSTINNLKKLREETGLSFTLCKKALDQSDNNIERAKKLLESWGLQLSASKLLRKTTAGAVFSYLHHNKKIGVLLELLCETDFVASNQEFQKLGTELTMQIASMNPQDQDGLIKELYIKDQKKTIDSLIKDYILKIGENIKVGRFTRFEI